MVVSRGQFVHASCRFAEFPYTVSRLTGISSKSGILSIRHQLRRGPYVVTARNRFILGVCAAVVAAVALVPAILSGAGKQPKKTDGGYTVTVGGYYEGSGTATVSPDRIRIRAQVVVAGSHSDR